MIEEYNTVIKNPRKVDIRFASCYPNIYRVAMSSMGYQIIYDYLNAREDIYAERVIYPQTKSIETRSDLSKFDIVSFTLQFEEDYINMVEMLKQSDIPLETKNRRRGDPLVIAGGPCVTSNPLPISKFIDLFIIGDAEMVLDNVIDEYSSIGNPRANLDGFLEIPGVYRPGSPVKKQQVKSMKDAWRPIYQIVTNTDDNKYVPAFGRNTFMLEVSRGCTRGCRFCMSGCMYRPRREVDMNTLIDTALKTRHATGQNRVALLGEAVSDYSKIEDLCWNLSEEGFDIVTPSLRIESVSDDLLEILRSNGLKTITIAPETTYSQRLKLNKPISDDQVISTINRALDLKFKIKMYLLLGTPGESADTIMDLVNYVRKITTKSVYYNTIKTSVNPLIPKPHTPLQYMGFDYDSLYDKFKRYAPRLKYKHKNESLRRATMQYVLSNGGGELNNILKIGKQVKFKDWYKLANSLNRVKKVGRSKLPWHEIDVGVQESYLKDEYNKMLNSEITPWCEEGGCYNCGAC